MTPAVRLEGVRLVAGPRLLLHLPRLVIEPGEQVAVVGPNGAGKSSLLKLIAGQVPAQQGLVQVLGRSLRAAGPPGAAQARALGTAERRALRRETGLLMQGLHLVPRLTARENALVGALGRLHGLQAWRSLLRWYPSALLGEADAALAALGLAEHAHTRADRLSGGERQKLALARLQLQRPRLLLADEPTAALDPAATALVCQALRALASGAGRTLVTVVHDLELLPLLAQRVIALADGRVLWDQPVGRVTAAMLQALYGGQPAAADAPQQETSMSITPHLAPALGALLLSGCAALGGHQGNTAGHGLVALKSPHAPAETMNRLEAEVKKRNLAVVSRIDHAAAAQRIGQALRPTELLVFGNPQAGTPLMQCAQRAGIDLPMKALVWSDAAGQTWLGYNEPRWLVQRHGGGDCPPAEQVGKALAAIAAATVAP